MSDGTETGADVGGTGTGTGRAARRDEAVRAAVEQGLLGPGTPIVGLLDVAGYGSRRRRCGRRSTR